MNECAQNLGGRTPPAGAVSPLLGQFYVGTPGSTPASGGGHEKRASRVHASKQRTECDRIWHRDSLVVIVRCALLYYRLFLGDQIYVVVVECFCFSLSKKHALFWRFFFSFQDFPFCLRMLATLTSGLRKPFRRGVEIVKIVRFKGLNVLRRVWCNSFVVLFWVINEKRGDWFFFFY